MSFSLPLSLYIYIYIYTHVYVYIYLSLSLYIYIYIYIYIDWPGKPNPALRFLSSRVSPLPFFFFFVLLLLCMKSAQPKTEPRPLVFLPPGILSAIGWRYEYIRLKSRGRRPVQDERAVEGMNICCTVFRKLPGFPFLAPSFARGEIPICPDSRAGWNYYYYYYYYY